MFLLLFLLLFLLFWLSFPQGICFLLPWQEGCGDKNKQQIPYGNDNQKGKDSKYAEQYYGIGLVFTDYLFQETNC